jgi:hypothetical protein
VGDVKHLAHQRTVHSAVIEFNYGAESGLQEKVDESIGRDFELCVHPQFFREFALKNANRVTHVELKLPRGKGRTEMNAFRYYAIFHLVGDGDTEKLVSNANVSTTYKWENNEAFENTLATSKSKGDEMFVISGIPNSRVKDSSYILGKPFESGLVDPEEIAARAEGFGYSVKILVNLEDPNTFDLLCVKANKAGVEGKTFLVSDPGSCVSYAGPLSNSPLKNKRTRTAQARLKMELRALGNPEFQDVEIKIIPDGAEV